MVVLTWVKRFPTYAIFWRKGVYFLTSDDYRDINIPDSFAEYTIGANDQFLFCKNANK